MPSVGQSRVRSKSIVSPYYHSPLQHYLRSWARWVKSWHVPLGYPTQSLTVRLMRPTVSYADAEDSFTDMDESVDGYILRSVDTCVENLTPNLKNAVRAFYLKEQTELTREGLRIVVGEAETILTYKLKTMGVLL